MGRDALEEHVVFITKDFDTWLPGFSKTYFILHGYDEDFSGYYGDDIFFRKILLDKFPDKIFIAPVDSYIQEFKDAFNLKRKLNCRLLLLRKKYNHSKDMLRFNFEFHKNYIYSELKWFYH